MPADGARSPHTPANGGRRIWRALGPGVITGAADDDPSGIATYSIAGAQFGTSMLWTAFLTWPLMAAVQLMCARIGMVTGQGLTTALRRRLPRPVLVAASVALLIANSINIGADLSGMADAAELLTGVGSHAWVVGFAIAIGWATIAWRYADIARVLKWLAIVLLAYVIAALKVGPDWSTVLRDTFMPTPPRGREGWATLVAILGTTISPYLFYWQASQEVEEEKLGGRFSTAERVGATPTELADRRLDVGVGTLFSNVAMYFIILTTALTLHRHGLTTLQSSREVAQALEPLAGRFSALLYTIGLIGTGLLAIPTLAGSSAYALAELYGWRSGIDERLRGAPRFYAVFVLALVAGVGLDFANVNPIRALFWSAVLNGVLAPFLLLGILLVASDARIMRGQPSRLPARIIVIVALLLMFAAAVAMVVL